MSIHTISIEKFWCFEGKSCEQINYLKEFGENEDENTLHDVRASEWDEEWHESRVCQSHRQTQDASSQNSGYGDEVKLDVQQSGHLHNKQQGELVIRGITI